MLRSCLSSLNSIIMHEKLFELVLTFLLNGSVWLFLVNFLLIPAFQEICNFHFKIKIGRENYTEKPNKG